MAAVDDLNAAVAVAQPQIDAAKAADIDEISAKLPDIYATYKATIAVENVPHVILAGHIALQQAMINTGAGIPEIQKYLTAARELCASEMAKFIPPKQQLLDAIVQPVPAPKG